MRNHEYRKKKENNWIILHLVFVTIRDSYYQGVLLILRASFGMNFVQGVLNVLYFDTCL